MTNTACAVEAPPHAEILARLDRWALAGVSSARVAISIRVKREELDRWHAGADAFNWPAGRFAEISHLVDAYLSNVERSVGEEPPKPVETSVTRYIADAIDRARQLSTIILIDAPPGLGKTEGVAQFLEAAPREQPVWSLTLRQAEISDLKVQSAIADEVGASHVWTRNGYAKGSFDDIAEATKGRRGVLIVDEANFLADARGTRGIRTLNLLRGFSDAGLFGIVLLGNSEVYERLSSDAAKFAQLLSRVESGRVAIKGLYAGVPGDPQLTEDDVCAVMESWRVGGAACQRLCFRLAARPGALRTMVGAFKHSMSLFGEISPATLESFLPAGLA